jgi:uncharacterized membrane protein YbhN (UPF0104 family)
MVLPVWRWQWLLRIQQFQVPFRNALALTWFSGFTANLLPGIASGDMVKGYLILRGRTQGRARAFSTVLADRALGFYSQVFIGSTAAVWFLCSGAASAAIWAMAAASMGLLLSSTIAGCLLLFPGSRTYLLRVFPRSWGQAWNESFEYYRQDMEGMLGCFVLSLLSNACAFSAFGVAAALLGQPAPWQVCFLTAPLIILANCLPLTPGGLGIAETVSSSLYGILGVSAGGEMMALVRVCGVLWSLPGAFAPLLIGATPSRDLRAQQFPDGSPEIASALSAVETPVLS